MTTHPFVSPRGGFSLLELIVALALVAVGLVAIAAAALLAQRTLSGTAAIDRITREVAAVLDSLAAEPEPASGERAAGGSVIRWAVAADSLGQRLSVEAEAGGIRLTFEARHAGW